MTARHVAHLMSDEAIRCRTEGHRWQPARAARVAGGFDVEEVCEACTAERRTDMTNRGAVRSRTISYPDGYLLPKGTGPLEPADRDRLRLTVFGWDFPDVADQVRVAS